MDWWNHLGAPGSVRDCNKREKERQDGYKHYYEIIRGNALPSLPCYWLKKEDNITAILVFFLLDGC